MSDDPTPWDWRSSGEPGPDGDSGSNPGTADSGASGAPGGSPPMAARPPIPQQAVPPRPLPPTPAAEPPPTVEQIWAEARSASDREPARLRLRPTRRIAGRSVPVFFGLVSLLVTIAVLGVLGARTMMATPSLGADAAEYCLLERSAVERAVAEHVRMTGIQPHHIDVLVNLRILPELPRHHNIRRDGDQVLIEATGPCASL